MNLKNKNAFAFFKQVLLFISMILLFSCKKYLDAKQNYSQSTPSTLFDLQAILDDAEYMNKRSPLLGEAVADDYFLPQEIYNSLDVQSQEMYRWALVDYTFPDDWGSLYNTVFNANLCLESLQKIGRTPVNAKQWDNVKGSALFSLIFSNPI